MHTCTNEGNNLFLLYQFKFFFAIYIIIKVPQIIECSPDNHSINNFTDFAEEPFRLYYIFSFSLSQAIILLVNYICRCKS